VEGDKQAVVWSCLGASQARADRREPAVLGKAFQLSPLSQANPTQRLGVRGVGEQAPCRRTTLRVRVNEESHCGVGIIMCYVRDTIGSRRSAANEWLATAVGPLSNLIRHTTSRGNPRSTETKGGMGACWKRHGRHRQSDG
jgi:hypothetical protein